MNINVNLIDFSLKKLPLASRNFKFDTEKCFDDLPDQKNPTTSTFLYFLNSTECRGKESIRKSSDFALKSLKKFDTKCAKWSKYFLGHRLVANLYSTKI